MYYLEAGYGKHNRMRNAVLLALALHAALLLGVSFKSSSKPYQAPQIDVTLAIKPSDTRVSEARHLAQANQEGSTEPGDIAGITSSGNELSSEQAAAPLAPRETPNDAQRNAVTTAAAARRAISSEQLEQEQSPLPRVSPEVDQLNRELADLEAQLDTQSRDYADLPRVRRLTSVATRHSADAAYLLDWRRRVEAVGNKIGRAHV